MANNDNTNKTYGTIDEDVNIYTSTNLDLLQSSRPGYGTRSVLEVSLNIVNATVGSGIIGLPFALMLSGFTVGIVVSVFISALTFAAVYSMILSGQKAQIFDFPSLAKVALGEFGYHMLNVMLFIQSAGSVISYLILTGDTIPVILGFYLPQYPILADRQLVTIAVAVFIIFPLNLFRSIGALARWSAFSVFLLPIMILTILVRAPLYSKDHSSPLFTLGKDPIAAIGIMSFAFVCSQVIFSNYLSQKNQSLSAWKASSLLSTIISVVISVTFAAIGYLSFGQDVISNIFNNFPADDHIINVGRLALGISMVLTVPMAFYPAREALQKTIGFETSEKQPTAWQHYSVTIVLFAIFLGFGIHVQSLGKVYSVVGGIASSFIAYTIPGFGYIAVFHPNWLSKLKIQQQEEQEQLVLSNEIELIKLSAKSTWWLDIASIVLVVFGLTVMFYTAIAAFF